MAEIERIQYQEALSIAGAWKGTNRSKLYEELGCESLSDRRRVRHVLLFYKIVNNSTPQYLKNKITAQRPVQERNSTPFFKCPVRYNSTNRFQNSFFPDAIKNWNVFIPNFQTMPSFTVLKVSAFVLFSNLY